MKRCWTTLRERGLFWSLASSLLGAGIGILIATLWGRTVGW